MSGSIWDRLGIERTRETRDVRRAYAARLKLTNPEDDAAGFQALREAYEAALRYCESGFDMSGVQFFYVASEDDDDDENGDGQSEERSWSDDPVAPAPDHPIGQEKSTSVGPSEGQLGVDSAGEKAALAASRERLVALLMAEPPASAAAFALALEDMMSQPALQKLDDRSDWELWLARQLNREPFRPFPLSALAIGVLNWRRNGDGPLGQAIDEVIDRTKAMEFLRDLRRSSHPGYAAYRLLSSPPPKSILSLVFKPSGPGVVHNLISRLNADFPSLKPEFPHLQAWVHWLETPRLPLSSLRIGIILLLVFGLVGGLGAERHHVVEGLKLGLLGAALPIIPAALWQLGRLLPRLRSQTSNWVGLGWVPEAGALLLLSVFFPPAPWAMAAFSVFGFLIIARAWTTREPSYMYAGEGGWLGVLRIHAYFAIWVALLLGYAPQAVTILLPALLTAALVSQLGQSNLLEFWTLRLESTGRKIGASGLLAVIGLAGALIWFSADNAMVQKMSVALTALAVLASRPMADALGEQPLKIRHWACWLGLVVVSALLIDETPGLTLVIAVWILMGPAIVGAAALWAALRESKRR